jgi:hypothetical protein
MHTIKWQKIPSALLAFANADGRTDRKIRKEWKTHFCSCCSRTHPNSHTADVYGCAHRDTVPVIFSALSHSTLLYKYCTNCTVCNWTVLTVITQKLPLNVQLHNSTAHLLYKYCTNCTVCNWTVLTVITQKLLLDVQLHNSTQTLKMMCVKWNSAGCFELYVYIQDHIKKLDPSKKCRWL